MRAATDSRCWGVIINQAKDALNGDGINLGQPWPEILTPTTNVTITHSYIYAGDDNLAIKISDRIAYRPRQRAA